MRVDTIHNREVGEELGGGVVLEGQIELDVAFDPERLEFVESGEGGPNLVSNGGEK